MQSLRLENISPSFSWFESRNAESIWAILTSGLSSGDGAPLSARKISARLYRPICTESHKGIRTKPFKYPKRVAIGTDRHRHRSDDIHPLQRIVVVRRVEQWVNGGPVSFKQPFDQRQALPKTGQTIELQRSHRESHCDAQILRSSE